MNLQIVLTSSYFMTLYCDSSRVVANSKESKSHKWEMHIERKYHLIWDIVERGEVTVCKITSEENLVHPFYESTASKKSFKGHLVGLGMRKM